MLNRKKTIKKRNQTKLIAYTLVQSGNLLSPPGTGILSRRRSSVMFSDVVLLHGDQETKNVCSSEKMTQTGDGNICWPAPSTTEPQTVVRPAAGQQVRLTPLDIFSLYKLSFVIKVYGNSSTQQEHNKVYTIILQN